MTYQHWLDEWTWMNCTIAMICYEMAQRPVESYIIEYYLRLREIRKKWEEHEGRAS